MSHSKQLPVASSLVATPAWAAYTAPEPRTWRAVRFLRPAAAAVCAQKLGRNLRSDAPRAPSADDRRRRAAAQWHNCQWSITAYASDDDSDGIRAYDRIRL